MNRSKTLVGAGIALALVTLLSTPAAQEQTCTLELKRTEGTSGMMFTEEAAASSFLFGMTPGQMLVFTEEMAGMFPADQEFSDVVKTEPSEYESDKPLRSLVRLGDHVYGLVLDTSNPKRGYDRLWFDTDHDGDLTDETVRKAEDPKEALFQFGGYAQCTYSFVELDIALGGEPFQYAFHLTATSIGDGDEADVLAQLTSAVYREGTITLGGESRRLMLLDNNANGRFDDEFEVSEVEGMPDNLVYSQEGDMLYLDPQDLELDQLFGGEWMLRDHRWYVSPLVTIGGAFHDLKITPDGGQLTVTPSSLERGRIRNENAPWSAAVYGDVGVFWVESGEDGTAELPVGEWKLLTYALDRTESALPEGEEEDAKESGLGALLGLFGGEDEGPETTLVAARARRGQSPITVTREKTVELPFGPPFRGVVNARAAARGQAHLTLEIVDHTGAQCEELLVKGQRPDDPKFVITEPSGKLVKRDSFEYG